MFVLLCVLVFSSVVVYFYLLCCSSIVVCVGFMWVGSILPHVWLVLVGFIQLLCFFWGGMNLRLCGVSEFYWGFSDEWG